MKEDRRLKGDDKHIIGKDGLLLTEHTKVMDRWKEPFESLYQETEEGSEQQDLELSQEQHGDRQGGG